MSFTCPNCGATSDRPIKFCTICGSAIATPAPAPLPVVAANPPLNPTVVISNPPPLAGSSEILLSNGARYPLISPTTIGRDESQCDIAIPSDGQASRMHARLEEFGGHWQITDLGSSNGTLVNGSRIYTPTKVFPGDQITIGQTGLSLNIPGAMGAPIIHPPVPIPQPLPLAPQPVIGGPLGIPQQGNWRSWQHQPLVEGYVRQDSGRYMVKKDDLWKKGCLAAAIGIFVAPFLVFLPFMTGNETPARDLRIEDRQSGRMVDVKVVGELMGSLTLGDAVAVWARPQKGVLVLERAYNYETDAIMQVKKV